MSGKGTRCKPGGRDPDSGNGERRPRDELAELAALAAVSSSQHLSGIAESVKVIQRPGPLWELYDSFGAPK